MKRNKKYDNEKELRHLYEEYRDTWSCRRNEEHGHYIDVVPYRDGWARKFTLRHDIANRGDVRRIRTALDLVNTEVRCHRKDFLRKDYRTKKWVPIKQETRGITREKYDSLPTSIQRWFEEKTLIRYNSTYTLWFFRFEWYFVFDVRPLVVTRRWIPDGEWESHCAYIQNKIDRGHLWPKINRMLGDSRRKYDWYDPWLKHKQGEDLDLELPVEEEVA